jgi:hypothetical protein
MHCIEIVKEQPQHDARSPYPSHRARVRVKPELTNLPRNLPSNILFKRSQSSRCIIESTDSTDSSQTHDTTVVL